LRELEAFIGLVLAAVLTQPLSARVVRVEITSRTDINNGKAFGLAGPYEKIQGRVYFSVDPANPHNRQIVDLDKAPRNAQGEVEFSADLYLLKPKDKPSDAVLVFMHPIGGGAYLPMINGLARAGHHVIYCNSRFRGTDSALLMEKVVEDLGECIKDAKNRLGYQKVVLAGWSGGGSLSVFYQQQAQRATITSSPSGDGPDLTPGSKSHRRGRSSFEARAKRREHLRMTV